MIGLSCSAHTKRLHAHHLVSKATVHSPNHRSKQAPRLRKLPHDSICSVLSQAPHTWACACLRDNLEVSRSSACGNASSIYMQVQRDALHHMKHSSYYAFTVSLSSVPLVRTQSSFCGLCNKHQVLRPLFMRQAPTKLLVYIFCTVLKLWLSGISQPTSMVSSVNHH